MAKKKKMTPEAARAMEIADGLDRMAELLEDIAGELRECFDLKVHGGTECVD